MRRARVLLASLLFQCILIAKVLKLWCRAIDPLALNRLRERQKLHWQIEQGWEATPVGINTGPSRCRRQVQGAWRSRAIRPAPANCLWPQCDKSPWVWGQNLQDARQLSVRSITKLNLTNVYVNYARQTIQLALIHSIISCSPCVDSTWGAHPSNRFALEISATK